MKHEDGTIPSFTDHVLWEVIVNGDLVTPVASANVSAEGPNTPKTAKKKLARKNKLKAESTLMIAIPDEHLLKFHACKDAKFQKLISQLEIHGEVISQEDENLKLLRSLPSTRNNISLIMRNKSDNFSSTNETVNNAHSVSTASYKDQACIASYADDVRFFFNNQSNASQLYNEYLEQIDTDDLEEMDLKWQGNRNRNAPRRNAPKNISTKNALVVQDGIATVLTKSGQVPVNVAKQSSHRAATSVTGARRVNTAAPRANVNDALPIIYSYFKTHSPLLDESQVLLKVPTNNNMYSFDLKNVVPLGGLTCLFVKATLDESNLWHKRLGRIIFKTMNKLVRKNLVRGLPSKLFENDHTCVACQKRKQPKVSCKTKTISSICKPLQLLHMDLFGPVSIRSINKKTYYLVVTDDFSRFSWVFFLATKDETPKILKNFIACIENEMDHNVKTIKCDNGTELKNRIMNEFFEINGIRRDFSVARTPQQNVVAERKNKTLIESSEDEVADDARKKGRERAQRNKLESMFGQDKDANGNSTYRMFTPVSTAGSSYDTADLQDTRIFSGAYDDEVEGTVVNFNYLEHPPQLSVLFPQPGFKKIIITPPF
nr:putative ribonuclease H-like domain-containing protein [Tanacetum cinerariifolium]